MRPRSPGIKINEVPRSISEKIREKIRAVADQSEFSGWSGADLKRWRTADPKLSQRDLSEVLGLSRLSVTYGEQRKDLSPLVFERLVSIHDHFNKKKVNVFQTPDGRHPEEEFAEALGNLRRLSNKYRPFLGRGELSNQVEQLIRRCDESLLDVYQLSITLQRAAEDRLRA